MAELQKPRDKDKETPQRPEPETLAQQLKVFERR
jgi:hypothetical protein